MNIDVKIMKLAKAKGIDIRKADRTVIHSLAIEARSPTQLVAALGSREATRVLDKFIQVSLPVLSFRNSKCEACDAHRPDVPACLACGCSGEDFERKKRSTIGKCPRGLW
jgi:hypothetical protein